MVNINRGEIKKAKLFRGILQGVRGGGTNLVVSGGGGAQPEGTDSDDCETGLQITVWRAHGVTFVVGGVPLFKPRVCGARRFPGGCVMRNRSDGSG